MSWWRKLSRSRPVAFFARTGQVVRWTLRILLVWLIVDFFYLALTAPDWNQLATGPVPKSAFMLEYEREHVQNGQRPSLRWQPITLATIPKHVQRAVILAEDSRFYDHSGFDLIAFKEAMDHNLAEGRLAVGASTISQQTVKNLFLSSARTPWRKWHELMLTWGMERHLNKRRILELYLNVAEFGDGIYGVQAAAQAYWGVGAGQLDARRAAELAATLPSPKNNNPATRTEQFEKRVKRILRLLVRYPGDAADAVAGWQEPPPEGSETEAAMPPACDEENCTTQAPVQPPYLPPDDPTGTRG